METPHITHCAFHLPRRDRVQLVWRKEPGLDYYCTPAKAEFTVYEVQINIVIGGLEEGKHPQVGLAILDENGSHLADVGLERPFRNHSGSVMINEVVAFSAPVVKALYFGFHANGHVLYPCELPVRSE